MELWLEDFAFAKFRNLVDSALASSTKLRIALVLLCGIAQVINAGVSVHS